MFVVASSHGGRVCLASEAIERAALPLECVDNVHSGDGLAFGVLSVSDGVTDDVLQEDLKYPAGLLVNEPGDALDTTATSQTSYGRLGYALDVVTKHFTMPLGPSFSQTFTALASSSHCRLRTNQ